MRPAYAIGDFRDPQAEVERLRAQADLVGQEDAALEALGLPDQGSILDLGCGPGFVADRLRRKRPLLRFVGLDRDRAVLAQAAGPTARVAGEAGALPFRDGCFDFVQARLVFRHLSDPAGAVAEVFRTLRPGGRAVITDVDDGALVLHPAPEGFGPVLAARQRTFQRRGADPFMGRRLPELIRRAGFVDSRVIPLPFTSFDIGAQAFAAVVLAPLADGIDPDLCPEGQVREAAAAIAAWGRRSDVFGMLTPLLVGGRRPGGDREDADDHPGEPPR